MTDHGLTPLNDDEQYWYNTETGEVDYGMIAPGPDRLGPFRTREEAERAPEVVKERAKAWRAEDEEEDKW